MRVLAILTMVLAFAAPALAAKTITGPAYTLVLTLSDKAAAKLAESHEQVHINGHYFGEARRASDGDEMGEVHLGDEDKDVPGAGSYSMGKARIDAKGMAKIKAKEPDLLINVYTSRKVFPDNLFDCGIFQDQVSVAAKSGIAIACKLIGEP